MKNKIEIKKDETPSIAIYELYMNRRNVADVIIKKPNIVEPKQTVQINWSAIGSTDIQAAEDFANGLLKLVKIARKYKRKR